MGLIMCPDCGKEISESAATCINCGRPMQAIPSNVPAQTSGGTESSGSGLVGAFIAIIGVVVGIVAMFAQSFILGIFAAIILIYGASYGAKYK